MTRDGEINGAGGREPAGAWLRVLARASRAFVESEKNLDVLFQVCAREVADATDAVCLVRLVSDDRARLQVVAIHGPPADVDRMRARTFPEGEHELEVSPTAEVVTSGRPMLVPDVGSPDEANPIPQAVYARAAKLGIRSLLSVPIRVQSNILGTITVVRYERGHPLTLEDQSFLEELADRAGLSIENARLYLELERRVQQRTRELEQRERQLREAQAISHIGSWEWDIVNNDVWWSDETYSIYGIDKTKGPITYEGFLGVLSATNRESFNRIVRECYETGKPFSSERRVVRADGQVRALLGRGIVETDAAGTPILMKGTVEDVTERKQLERQVAMGDRMTRLGTLAAGVAHELNNPLVYVVTNLELAEEKIDALPPGLRAGVLDEVREMISDARTGADRVRKIVAGLRTFSRGHEEHYVPLDVHPVLELAIEMAAPEIRYRAHVVRAYEPVPQVFADEARLGQVFVNLLVNAGQAIAEGSYSTNTITVATRTSDDGRAIIEVADTGRGMAPEVLERVFEPFFTTKVVGEGTGLGLAICHGIITACGGTIAGQSEVGKGSVMRVVLPRAPDPAIVESVPSPPRSPSPTATRARVLVVDDDPMVGSSIRRVLAAHEVKVVSSGAEALAEIRAHRDYDVVLCDIMMSKMTGMELHASILRDYPVYASRFVFITGGAFTPWAREFLSNVPNPRLEKPFEAQALIAIVQDFVKQ